jgi:hypothetical protein
LRKETQDELATTDIVEWAQRQMEISNSAGVRMAGADDISRIAAAYAAWGYGGGITHHDTAWVAEMGGEVVGTVRVAPEHGTFVLRGMQIAER